MCDDLSLTSTSSFNESCRRRFSLHTSLNQVPNVALSRGTLLRLEGSEDPRFDHHICSLLGAPEFGRARVQLQPFERKLNEKPLEKYVPLDQLIIVKCEDGARLTGGICGKTVFQMMQCAHPRLDGNNQQSRGAPLALLPVSACKVILSFLAVPSP